MKNNAVTAAQILVTVKTGLGKVVPDYAKKIVASNNAEGANAIRVVRWARDNIAKTAMVVTRGFGVDYATVMKNVEYVLDKTQQYD